MNGCFKYLFLLAISFPCFSKQDDVFPNYLKAISVYELIGSDTIGTQSGANTLFNAYMPPVEIKDLFLYRSAILNGFGAYRVHAMADSGVSGNTLVLTDNKGKYVTANLNGSDNFPKVEKGDDVDIVCESAMYPKSDSDNSFGIALYNCISNVEYNGGLLAPIISNAPNKENSIAWKILKEDYDRNKEFYVAQCTDKNVMKSCVKAVGDKAYFRVNLFHIISRLGG
ncbi:hypothetical protein RJ492_001205 [Pluralibacter gergoviae]|uniref:Uncharacterized protein n=1 Tax=Pluralibacter gergoviae TaxID=61647 RepID=A0AAI9GMJ1_PLUGE|nr:hypothetical protein [Pluralibacter gergoviae]EKV9907712.1 hypothetical protein [Pluralibacter gergoviae]EKW7276819.1 hypothetical protein [Pluralibacter gergoviae]ELD4293956.1 hypothetical protein [Pluralibacter gergoviae]ELD4304735.1 hypothetical protein [Pluralibacter gergoviae]